MGFLIFFVPLHKIKCIFHHEPNHTDAGGCPRDRTAERL